jgi:tRNA-binding EMAP/Myf-like protein
MKKQKIEGAENYSVQVVKINKIYDIEGADKIKRVQVFSNDVIVGNDVKEGDVMLYITAGSKLNEEFCKFNNLLDDVLLNKDGKNGYISHKKFLVKAIKLKGIISNGLLLPLTSLFFKDDNDISKLTVGDEFNIFNEHIISDKYVVVSTQRENSKKEKNSLPKVKNVITKNQFRFHFETPHFDKNIRKIENRHIVITRKLHGSSLIISNVLIEKRLTWYEKLLRKFTIDVTTNKYGMVVSSGKPKSNLPKFIVSDVNEWVNNGRNFYKQDHWKNAFENIGDRIEKGITIYAEMVGEGIQGAEYTYNQKFGIYVYRITMTNVDGNVQEFGWNELKKYCEKYELNYCEEYYQGTLPYSSGELQEYLKEKYLNKSYSDCKNDEGICIRVSETNEIFKFKSPNFILRENQNLDKGVVDIEAEQ